jgi:hypothetical protein
MNGMQIIASGVCNDGASVTVTSRTLCWKLLQDTSANDATVTFDGRYTVYLDKQLAAYVDIPGDYQTITASGNNVHYIVFG